MRTRTLKLLLLLLFCLNASASVLTTDELTVAKTNMDKIIEALTVCGPICAYLPIDPNDTSISPMTDYELRHTVRNHGIGNANTADAQNAGNAELIQSIKQGLTQAEANAYQYQQYSYELISQSIEIKLAYIATQIQMIQNEIDRTNHILNDVGTQSKQFTDAKKNLETARDALNKSVQNAKNFLSLLSGLQENSDQAFATCTGRIAKDTALLLKLMKHTDPLLIPIQQIVASSDAAADSVLSISKNLTDIDTRLKTLNQRLTTVIEKRKAADEVANEKKANWTAQYSSLMQQINTQSESLNTTYADYHAKRLEYEQARRDKQALELKKSQATNPSELQSINWQMQQLDQKLSTLSWQLSSIAGTAANGNQNLWSYQSSLQLLTLMSSSERTTATKTYNDLTQESDRIQGDASQLHNQLLAAPAAINSSCSQIDALEQQLDKAKAAELVAFEEALDTALDAHPKNDDGLVDTIDFKLTTNQTSPEGTAVRYLMNRQLVIETWSKEEPAKYDLGSLDLSRSLIFGFDQIATAVTPDADAIANLRDTVKTIQNYGAHVFSFALGFVPGVSQIKDMLEISLGHDVITGNEYSGAERTMLAVGMMLPLGGTAVAESFVKGARFFSKPWLKYIERAGQEVEGAIKLAPRSATELNKELLENLAKQGVENPQPAWEASRTVYETALNNDTYFLRVHASKENWAGDFLMNRLPKSDTPLTRESIADLLALPGNTELRGSFITVVKLKGNTPVRVGTAAANAFGTGGAMQWEIAGSNAVDVLEKVGETKTIEEFLREIP